ncbi:MULTISPECIES: hypothetical protein [unclassified Variovorax]|uniref:hypothetical protein n=1 Tax=unclassified Variovorax TaxID=663243 RepID=UPI000884D794|nr:hypothetical protein [Variovorax sp. CF079]SDD30171.1 hypothetical protein SAMN05444679_109143 [Variovorax sp. CF079]
MTTIQARRRLIVIVLLCVAAGGALLRHFAAPGSTARDVGTLLMVLWLPVIGSVVAWLFAKLRRTAPGAADSSGFEARSAFHPHALVELTMRASQLPSEDVPIAEGEYRCALVVDNEGFSARWLVAPGRAFRRGTAQALEVEFLTPALALPRFPRDAVFRMLVDESFVGDGRVLRVLDRA